MNIKKSKDKIDVVSILNVNDRNEFLQEKSVSNDVIDQILIEYCYFSDESLSNENFYSDLLNNVQKDKAERLSDSMKKFVLWLEFLENKRH